MMTDIKTAWDDPEFVQAWNDTYGLNMERAPIRGRFVFPWIEQNIGQTDGKKLLDLGCGNGNLIRHFSKTSFAELIGTDTGRAVIGTAEKLSDDERIKFIHTDSEGDFPFDTTGNNFDVLTSVFVVEEIPLLEFSKFCGVISKALNTSGKAFVFTNHPSNALAEDLTAVATGGINEKFLGHRGYFDTSPNQYTLRVMNRQGGIAKKADYHHKPISKILNEFYKAGLGLHSFLEVPKGVLDYNEMKDHSPKSGDIPRFAAFIFEKR